MQMEGKPWPHAVFERHIGTTAKLPTGTEICNLLQFTSGKEQSFVQRTVSHRSYHTCGIQGKWMATCPLSPSSRIRCLMITLPLRKIALLFSFSFLKQDLTFGSFQLHIVCHLKLLLSFLIKIKSEKELDIHIQNTVVFLFNYMWLLTNSIIAI